MINIFAWIDPFLIGAFQTNFFVCLVKTLSYCVFEDVYKRQVLNGVPVKRDLFYRHYYKHYYRGYYKHNYDAGKNGKIRPTK